MYGAVARVLCRNWSRRIATGGATGAEPARVSPDGLLEVTRVGHGLYQLAPNATAVGRLGTVGFIDVCEPGTTMAVGRPFAMIEGPGSRQLTLVSPLSGEVVAVNGAAIADPVAVAGASVWLAEVDAFLDDGESEPEWDALCPIPAAPR